MAEETDQFAGFVAKFYTRARRFPKLIGKLHDGTRIPGGPYTITQVIVGGLFLFVAMQTRSLWTWGSLIIDLPLALATTWGVAWVFGLIPQTNRNILSVAASGLAAFSSPLNGRFKGKPVRFRQPHRARSRVALDLGEYTAEAGDTTTVPEPDILQEKPLTPILEVGETSLSSTTRTRAVSGVERLLGQVGVR